MKKEDLKGRIFGRLFVIKQDNTSKRVKWICKCECGNYKSISATHLKSGATTSCGCYQKEKASESNKTHNKTHSSLYNRWKSIKQRCNNPNNKSFPNYGGRDIKICEEWMNFENFYNWAINNGYSKELQLDRIDNNGNYEPNNCRWAKAIDNNHNRRNTVKIDGMTIREFSEKFNMTYTLVHTRYYLLKNKGMEINTNNILLYANQLPINDESH